MRTPLRCSIFPPKLQRCCPGSCSACVIAHAQTVDLRGAWMRHRQTFRRMHGWWWTHASLSIFHPILTHSKNHHSIPNNHCDVVGVFPFVYCCKSQQILRYDVKLFLRSCVYCCCLVFCRMWWIFAGVAVLFYYFFII